MELVLGTALLPSVAYFALLKKADEVWMDHTENYQKQSHRNRCFIQTSQGTQMLTVPVKGSSKGKPVSEALIDYGQDWEKVFLRSLQTSYGKSPFFEYYIGYFEKIIHGKPDKLAEINMMLLTLCLKLMKIKKEIQPKKTFEHQYPECFDLRSGSYDDLVASKPYLQVFGNIFVPKLSIIDLLFCEGPNATNVLDSSIIIP